MGLSAAAAANAEAAGAAKQIRRPLNSDGADWAALFSMINWAKREGDKRRLGSNGAATAAAAAAAAANFPAFRARAGFH